MSRYRITWGKGLNVDAMASELEDGFFNDAQNVAVRDGFASPTGADIALVGGSIDEASETVKWLGVANLSGTYLLKYDTLGTVQLKAATVGLTIGAFSDISPAAVTLPDTAIRITDGMLNGVYLINVPNTGLYYWISTLANATAVTGAPVATYMCPFGYYIFMFGITDGADYYPQRVVWSNAAEPGSLPTSFTAGATNDAGNVDLAETAGEIVDALPLGDTLIIYKKDCRYAVRYVGGNSVFSFDRLPGEEGIHNNGCVVDTPVGHVFVSNTGEVMLHQGGACKNISSGRVNSLLAKNLQLLGNYRALKNPVRSEVWIWYEILGKFLVWNWITDTWGTHTPTFSFGGQENAMVSDYVATEIEDHVILGAGPTNIYRLGVEPDKFPVYPTFSAKTSYVARSGLDLGDPDFVKNLHRTRWNFNGLAGKTFSIQHGSSMTADGAVTYASAATYTLGTSDYVDSRATGGRYLAVKCSWTTVDGDSEEFSKVRSTDLDVAPGGKR